MTLVVADRVSYQYLDGTNALDATSLRVRAGETWLVTGPSGCGKSTFARCLSGIIPHLYRGDLSGSVTLNGFLTHETPMWQLAEQAGMLFQNPAAQLLTASVRDEIIFGLEQQGCSRSEIDIHLQKAVQLFGLDDLQTRPSQMLSDGEKQKVALAAVMARRPGVLILDEPFSMLDITAEQDLISELERVSGEGTAVIVFEHREAQLHRLADLRVLAMRCDLPPMAVFPARLPWARVAPFEVQVRGLGVSLGGRRVLDDLDMEIRSGEVTAIIGRNGVGKTTLLRSLVGLQRHDGRIVLAGDDAALQLGMVFQNPDLQLFNPSVREEILFHLPEADMDYYRWLLEALALTRYESSPPLLLSEGEKKRLGLATVLMRQPRHGILLDEPSLGQDALHKGILLQVLQAVAAQERSVVMTTHDLDLARAADRVILLGENGIVCDGPAGEVFQRHKCWAEVGLRLQDSPGTERGAAL